MRDSKVADKQPEQKKLRKPAYEKKNPRAHAEWLGRKHERNEAKRRDVGPTGGQVAAARALLAHGYGT